MFEVSQDSSRAIAFNVDDDEGDYNDVDDIDDEVYEKLLNVVKVKISR
jgi:hypothetical protein